MWIGATFLKVKGGGVTLLLYEEKERVNKHRKNIPLYTHTHRDTHTHVQRERNTFYKSKSSESLSYSTYKSFYPSAP